MNLANLDVSNVQCTEATPLKTRGVNGSRCDQGTKFQLHMVRLGIEIIWVSHWDYNGSYGDRFQVLWLKNPVVRRELRRGSRIPFDWEPVGAT